MKTSIAPLTILLVVLPAYYLEWIQSQSTFYFFLLGAGVTGTILQHIVEEWMKRKEGHQIKAEDETIKQPDDPIKKLPKEVQDLIKEGESMNIVNQEMKTEKK